jgi:hypothetical protein
MMRITSAIRARGVEDWTFGGELSTLGGRFLVVEHPPPAFSYAFFLRRDQSAMIGAVGAVTSAEESLIGGARTGTATGFIGGNWLTQ